MCNIQRKYRSSLRPWIFVALLFFYNIAYPQTFSEPDTLIVISHITFPQIRGKISFFSNDASLKLRSSLVPPTTLLKNKNSEFFVSLKVRASKSLLTRKLYDFVVVNPDTTNKKQITGRSDANYIRYSGKKIRKIEIQKLNVFGTDINNPASNNPKKINDILNSTHFNTNENIIRKNLLFSEGDEISPLLLSDNERLLRQLPYIDDARIIVVPVSDELVDILVLTKDVYSLGALYTYKGLENGSVSVFDKNIFGMGHEFGLDVPYNSKDSDSPGIGVHYLANNIGKSFINLNVYFLYGLGEKTYGFDLSRNFVSSTTKYAGGISVRQMYTTENLDTLLVPAPLKYNLQDYWLSRSFLINKESVSRIIIGVRYTNNNVFDRPIILPESYYNLQNYRIFLGSLALSIQKYYKTNLLYSYGRTEDIPYGALFKFTAGREFNEFKLRTYLGGEVSLGKSINSVGYFYNYAGLSTYLNENQTEQGVLTLGMNYFSNLVTIGNIKIRNFVNFEYMRGFNRYSNEFLKFENVNGFSGFKNDSVNGTQRLSVSLESVLFSQLNIYGFRFAFFGFTDFSFLSGTNEILGNGYSLSSIGVGIRIRNDNLVFNTFQIRIGFFPNPPSYSKTDAVVISGEQLLRPNNFDPGPPSIIPYR
ncbi:MAG: hypothetical protein ABSF81_13270 [Bacteroidales bacterium]